MNCLVTGGAGFLGSHLVDRLIAEGHDVTVIDNYSAGITINADAMYVKDDIVAADPGADRRMLAIYREEWDVVFHLAGKADVVPSIENPTEYFRTNTLGTEAVCEFVRRGRVKKLIYAASSSCYGPNPPIPVDEDAPIVCAHPYALTKRLGEELVLHYGQVYRLPVVSLRLFNVYGPRARTTGAYGAVLGTFLAQRANGAPLTIVGDGIQSRDFVWVADVVDAFIRAAESSATGVFNIGSGVATSIRTLARLIGGPRVHIPERKGEPLELCADADKARRTFGWRARTTLQDGIEQLLEDLTPWKDGKVWSPDSIAEATAEWHRYMK